MGARVFVRSPVDVQFKLTMSTAIHSLGPSLNGRSCGWITSPLRISRTEIIYTCRGVGNESRELYISTRASAGDVSGANRTFKVL